VVAGLRQDVWFWFPLRFVIGAATALLWISSEALINELAEDHWRGRIIGLYSSVGAAGFAMGPLLLVATGSAGLLPFVVTSVLILSAGLPLFMVRPLRLRRHEEQSAGLWRVFWLAPTVMLANVVYAAAAESLLTFFPLFGLGLGLTENYALWLMTLVGLGTMVLVFPAGWLADHVDRMGLLLICTVLTMVGLLLMPALVQVPVVAEIYAFLFGGVEGMIYALGVMLIGQQFRGAMLASATTLFTACWGAGTILGPLLVGLGMDRWGSESMAPVIFAFYLVFLPLPLVSYLRRRAAAAVHTSGE
jgi:MFS family permease